MAWPTITLALLVTEVRTLLGEPTARRVSDTDIYSAIDKAFALMSKNGLAYQGTGIQTLATATYTYAMPADCVAMRAVIYLNIATGAGLTCGPAAQALLKMHPRHFSNVRASTADYPKEWAYFGNTLYVWPMPIVGANAHLLLYFYDKIVEGASGIKADESLLTYMPRQYWYYAVWYAYSQMLFKIGKPEQALQYGSYFNNFIAFHRERDNLHIGEVDSADMMNLPDRVEFVG